MANRLEDQIAFILEVDKLKTVLRQNVPITEPHRQENDAEHSWHLAMMALLLAEYADEPVDISRVVAMVLVHDLVEIDAGDTFLYDNAAHHDKQEREIRAADRLFGMLPEDQALRYRALWDEFEAHQSADARFANAIDRLQPVLLNIATKGLRWRVHGVTADKVLARNQVVAHASERLWTYLRGRIEEMVAEGHLPAGPTPSV